jgi:hypothetical protein
MIVSGVTQILRIPANEGQTIGRGTEGLHAAKADALGS